MYQNLGGFQRIPLAVGLYSHNITGQKCAYMKCFNPKFKGM